MNPSVKFYIDYEEDLRYTLFRLTHLDPAGIEHRIKQKDLDKDVVSAILKSKDRSEQKDILDKYLSSYYKSHLAKMKTVAKKYQDIWDGKGKVFFPLVTKMMGSIPWKYNEYLFLVGSFYGRASWGEGNKLGVWWKRNPEERWCVSGYELVLTHYFETVDNLFDKRPVSDRHLWALAEATAYILVYKEQEMIDQLWPNLKEPEKFGYPQLIKPIKDLYPVYKKADYAQYVQKGIDYIKRYSQEELTKPQ